MLDINTFSQTYHVSAHSHLSVIVRDDALQQRDGTVDLLLGHESEDADHREAAVVDLGDEAALLRFEF